MASAAKFLLDEALNKTDIDSNEVSAIVDTLQTQLNEQKKQQISSRQNNLKDNLNNNNNHANASIINSSVTISSDSNQHHYLQQQQQQQLTSNGHQQQQEQHISSEENQIYTANNNISNFVNNNISTKSDSECVNNQNLLVEHQQVVVSGSTSSSSYSLPSTAAASSPSLAQSLLTTTSATNSNNNYHQQYQQYQNQNKSQEQKNLQHLQNMPKSNEPIKLVYPISSNHQQHQTGAAAAAGQTPQNITTITTMNSSNQATGNRVTFTSQSLPNGTINITSQPQQIMHAVSVASGIPNATTIKTITSGGGGGTGQQSGQQNQNHPPGTTQLVIKNQAVSLPAGLVSSAPGMVTMTKTINQGNQQNIVGAPMLPTSVVVGVRPGTPTQTPQKNVGGPLPRVVIGGPHMVGTRPTSPAITLSALQPGQSGPALILKTENGYQLLRVGPPPAAPVTQNMTNSGNQTIRLQTVPAVSRFTGPPLALRKTIVTQHQTKQKSNQSIATSATSIVVNSVTSTNATQVLASQANSSVQQSQPTIASVAPVPSLTHQHQQQQQHQQNQPHQTQSQQQHPVTQQQNTTTSASGTTQTTQSAATQGNTKEKCRKFLANLIELSSREPKSVEKNVRTLIQELIDANVEPEEFCDRLERLLNASPQPCLIGFLKKSLPLLRQSLFTKELVIEGIKPPPQHVVGMIGSTTLSTTQLPKIQAQIRPIGQQTTTIGQTQVRMVTQTGPRPIGQTTITKQTVGGVRIQGPIQSSTSISSGPRLVNAQIRPIGVSSSGATIVQTSNVQSPPALQPTSGSQTVFTPQQNVVQIRTSAPVNRSPATVQIRATAPIVRASAPVVKNAGSTSITQVKVGQTQIKPIPSQNVVTTMPTLTIPVNSNATQVSTAPATTPTPTLTNVSTNKVVTIKAQSAQQQSSKKSFQEKEKKAASTASSYFQQSAISMSTSMYGDDDINDVAAMGGVNLAEESQKILGSTELIGTQIRSCKDEVFLHLPALQNRIRAIIAEKGMEEPSQEVAVLISHACQERLKNIVEKLAVIAEHRIDIIKVDPRYEVTKDVRGQIKFLEELDKSEQKRHEEQEREMLMRAAKSRAKIEDPEQAKLKAKAKEMQRAEMEELRQRDANMTALQAIGPRKKPKLDGDAISLSAQSGTTGIGTSGISPAPLRPRIKRVNLRDMLFFMEQERETCRSTMLYKAYLK